MARPARAASESGYYHVVLRGNGKQLLFEDDIDRHAFVDMAAEQLGKRGIDVIAWCLMDNHVHLLLRDVDMQLSGAITLLRRSTPNTSTEETGIRDTCSKGVSAVFPSTMTPICSKLFVTFTTTLRKRAFPRPPSIGGAAIANMSEGLS